MNEDKRENVSEKEEGCCGEGCCEDCECDEEIVDSSESEEKAGCCGGCCCG